VSDQPPDLTPALIPQYRLIPRSGPSLRVPERGLLFGRAPECDVVLADRKSSKHHALVRPSLEGLDLFALGRNPTRVNGEPTERFARLQARDRLELPGGSWRVALAEPGADVAVWQVHVEGGGQYGLRWAPITIGGGEDDDICVSGWPAGALRFLFVRGTLAVEIGAPMVAGGVALPAVALDLPAHGDRFESGGVAVTLLAGRREAPATAMADEDRLPEVVRFEFLPDGGRLTVHAGGAAPRSLELPELRGRLVAALLKPPGKLGAGDWVPDEVLIPAVWSGAAERGRTDLNLLLHHTRKALARAGVDPALLDRARRGGGTRFKLAPGARIDVR
jgi:hypothetical protein